MKYFGLALLFFLFFSTASFAQEIVGDTIEGTSTDTSIVYIIKKPPVKIKEKVEIERQKQKQFYYCSMGFGGFTFTDHYKSRNGNAAYAKLLNDRTRPMISFSGYAQLYFMPKKTIWGAWIDAKRMSEQFVYRSNTTGEIILPNSYTYGGGGLLVGKWFNKEKKISFQTMGSFALEHLFGVSGYSFNPASDSLTTFIAQSVAYKKYHVVFTMQFKVLYQRKNSFIEIVPYFNFTPFSTTKKTDIIAVRRNIFGINVGFTNKLF
ncbi:MAG TPA: hypothetical protein VNB90_00655 [Cytophagaceae bacterium]|jgi:hypothetical protein|nr:hypothetical protein [Cytophagaceae bacterium]